MLQLGCGLGSSNGQALARAESIDGGAQLGSGRPCDLACGRNSISRNVKKLGTDTTQPYAAVVHSFFPLRQSSTLAQLLQRLAQASPRDAFILPGSILVRHHGRQLTRSHAPTNSNTPHSSWRPAELALFSHLYLGRARGQCVHKELLSLRPTLRYASTATRTKCAEDASGYPTSNVVEAAADDYYHHFSPKSKRYDGSKYNNKGAAEGEYLQEREEQEIFRIGDETTQPAINEEPIRRYDWRGRAASRIRKPDATEEEEPKEYKRRVRKPPTDYIAAKSQLYAPAIREYTNKFLELLVHEEAQDEAALRERLNQWGLERLQKEGYCLTGMGAYWLNAYQFGRPVAAFSIGPGIVLPENKFETGSQVLISRVDPTKETTVTGSVLARSATQLRICFPHQFLLDEGTWRVDLGRPNLIYDRMRTAISQLETNPIDILKLVPSSSSEYILEGTELRDILLKSFDERAKQKQELKMQGITTGVAAKSNDEFINSMDQSVTAETVPLSYDGAFKDDQLILSWVKRYSQPNPIVVEGDPPLNGLNPTQIRAMAMMIGERFSLIQGPPGTGKTKTIIDTVKLLKIHFQVAHPLLLCTYTNVAVDNLVEGLVRAGVKPLRIGYHGTIKNSLITHSLDYKIEQHPLTATIKKLTDEQTSAQSDIDDLLESYRTLERKVEDAKPLKPRRNTIQRLINMREALVKQKTRSKILKSKIFSLQQKMLTDIVAEADVVCTTCITSACYALNIMDFPVVYIDEASMSTEPASLIPIMKGSEHVSLIGDHKQLPPVITSPKARDDGFGISLFERLIEENHVPSVMLNIQYRMHPNISRFPAKEFYDLSLLDGTVDASGKPLPGLEPVNSKHTGNHNVSKPSVIFLHHSGNECYQGKSLLNVKEAHIVAAVVEDLLLNNPSLKGEDIGIIAPYMAQIKILTRFLGSNAEYRRRFQDVLGERAREVPLIEIKTVDGFEGREKQVIIFSTVRNNESGHIGFLADKKRLNVGLTRAKRGLFVVGSITTLREGKMRMTSAKTVVGKGAESWRRYADYLLDSDLVVPLEGNALQRALYEHVEFARRRQQTLLQLPQQPLKITG